jgi:hypothetical protein
MSNDSGASYNGGPACNGVTISLVLAACGFGWIGYHYGAAYGTLGGILGVLGGVVVGVFATPLVFIGLMLLIHVVSKVEEYFKPRDD